VGVRECVTAFRGVRTIIVVKDRLLFGCTQFEMGKCGLIGSGEAMLVLSGISSNSVRNTMSVDMLLASMASNYRSLMLPFGHSRIGEPQAGWQDAKVRGKIAATPRPCSKYVPLPAFRV
jgi:hypothetical protein